MYFYPKLFHRCHVIPLRDLDVKEITRQTNRILYCDLFERPDMISRFQSRKAGGLGLHSIQHKANAMLTSSFLEMAANPCFQRNKFYEAIYAHYVLQDPDRADPGLPPYYSQSFLEAIRVA